MKKLLLFMILVFAAYMSFSQEKSEDFLPDEHVMVNKEYDDKGNLILYDSTYVRRWSSNSTLNPVDIEAILRGIDGFWGSGLSDLSRDTSTVNVNPFFDFDKLFSGMDNNFYDSFFGEFSDSIMGSLHEKESSYLEYYREKMMNSFDLFFKGDTLAPEFLRESPFISKGDMELFFQEFDKNFQQNSQ